MPWQEDRKKYCEAFSRRSRGPCLIPYEKRLATNVRFDCSLVMKTRSYNLPFVEVSHIPGPTHPSRPLQSLLLPGRRCKVSLLKVKLCPRKPRFEEGPLSVIAPGPVPRAFSTVVVPEKLRYPPFSVRSPRTVTSFKVVGSPGKKLVVSIPGNCGWRRYLEGDRSRPAF